MSKRHEQPAGGTPTPAGNVFQLATGEAFLGRSSRDIVARKVKLPRRTGAQSVRLEFPLLEDDLERMATNAATCASVFHHIHRQLEDLRRTEQRDGANSAIRRAVMSQVYAMLNDASRHSNPYRRPHNPTKSSA